VLRKTERGKDEGGFEDVRPLQALPRLSRGTPSREGKGGKGFAFRFRESTDWKRAASSGRGEGGEKKKGERKRGPVAINHREGRNAIHGLLPFIKGRPDKKDEEKKGKKRKNEKERQDGHSTYHFWRFGEGLKRGIPLKGRGGGEKRGERGVENERVPVSYSSSMEFNGREKMGCLVGQESGKRKRDKKGREGGTR